MHGGNPINDIIALKYLEALEKVADGQATKILLPLETAGILGSIVGILELFKEKNIHPRGKRINNGNTILLVEVLRKNERRCILW